MRTTSAELYSGILIRACRNGWRYPRSQIESGFNRHLGELKLQLVDQGYTIVPDVTANNSHRGFIETAFAAMANLRLAPVRLFPTILARRVTHLNMSPEHRCGLHSAATLA